MEIGKKLGGKRYFELTDTEIDADLGHLIYVVAMGEMRVRGTTEEKETPRKPRTVGIFMSKRSGVGGNCGRQELMGRHRWEIEIRCLNSGAERR